MIRILGARTGAVAAAAAAGSVGGPPKMLRRTTDATAINNNGTLANDSQLVLPVGANDVWYWIARIILNAASATMDYKIGFSVPASGTMLWGADGTPAQNAAGYGAAGTANSPVALLAESGSFAGGSVANTFGIGLSGTYVGGGTAGNVNMQFAQNTPEVANLVVKAHSWWMAVRVA